MSIGDANAAQRVLEHLVVNQATLPPAVADAAATLADRSYAVLHAGIDGGDVRQVWPDDDEPAGATS